MELPSCGTAPHYERHSLPPTWGAGFEHRLAFSVRGLLSREECDELVALADHSGWSASPMAPLQSGLRARVDSTAAAGKLFSRLRPYLPPVHRRAQLLQLTPTLRFIKYSAGEEVLPHPDTSGGDKWTPVAEPNLSFFTSLWYLTSGYTGCDTHLLPPPGALEADPAKDVWPTQCRERGIRTCPGLGGALVFEHDIVHGAPPLTILAPPSGVGRFGAESQAKIVVRVDVVYSGRDLDGRSTLNAFRDPTLAPAPSAISSTARQKFRDMMGPSSSSAATTTVTSSSPPPPTPSSSSSSSSSSSAAAAAAAAEVGGARGSNRSSSGSGGSAKVGLAERIRAIAEAKTAKDARALEVRPTVGGDAAVRRWAGRVAVVTGASSGIGAAVCRALAVEWRMLVVGVARRGGRLKSLKSGIEKSGGYFEFVALDVTAPDAPQLVTEAAAATFDRAVEMGRLQLFAKASKDSDGGNNESQADEATEDKRGSNIGGRAAPEACVRAALLAGPGAVPEVPQSSPSSTEHRGVAVLVNNAGANPAGAAIRGGTTADCRVVFELNALAPLALSRAAIDSLESRKAKRGAIVNVSSLSAHRLDATNNGVYAASKAALRTLSEATRRELREAKLPYKVRTSPTIERSVLK